MNKIFYFFVLFSIFEGALKNSDYLKFDSRSGVRPDWDKFSEEIKNKIEESSNQAIVDLLSNPPKTQKPDTDGVLKWIYDVRIDQKPTKADKIIHCIKSVRNNLFHGGKYETGFASGSRNIKLVTYGTSILLEMVTMDYQVRMNFKLEYEQVKQQMNPTTETVGDIFIIGDLFPEFLYES